MAIETERFQVAIATGKQANSGGLAILLDTATGRSWICTRFGGTVGDNQWQPMTFAADAPAAPIAKPARRTTGRTRRSKG